MSSSAADDTPLGDLSDRVMEKAEGGHVPVHELMEAAGNAAYGPLLLLIALITLTPIGSIPGASVVAGLVLVLLGAQMLIGRGCPWVPSWVGQRRVSSERIRKALTKSRPLMDKVDRLPRPRLQSFLEERWMHAVSAGVIAMGLLMFPLAFVPWGVVVPATALLIVGLGLMGKDGLLTAAGLVAMTVAGGASIYLSYTTLIG